jgi:hypothetical protein
LFIIISFNVNTTQGARGGGWGVLTVQRQAHHTHTGSSKGDNLHVRLSHISRSQSQGSDRGRSSIDYGSRLTDSRYRSKLIVLHEGSLLQQSLTNMKVSPLFVLERFAYTHTYTSSYVAPTGPQGQSRRPYKPRSPDPSPNPSNRSLVKYGGNVGNLVSPPTCRRMRPRSSPR